ncbi:MAG: hypothetical protein JWO95_1552 [Verrucomicrobiales bacterium]|nr:hypothetical protein [Verrucomicrobiales bacterium]
MADLHNSLYYLDQAKQQWAADNNKSELDTPTLQDLIPLLGKHKKLIEDMLALGIEYKITSLKAPQSDVATLTQDIHFRAGWALLDGSAGTTYCISTHWTHPSVKPRELFPKVTFFISLVVCLLLFLIKKMIKKKRTLKPAAI